MMTRQEALKKIEKFENLFINGQSKEDHNFDSTSLQTIIDTYPDMIDKVVPLTLEAGRKSGKFFGFSFGLSSFDENTVRKICNIYKNEVASPDNTPYTLHSIYSSCNSLKQKWPFCTDDTFAILKDGLKSEKNDGFSLETLYLYGLSSSIKDKPALAKDPELLDLIEKCVQKGQDNDRSLRFCYMLLADIAKHNPAASEKIIEIFDKALKLPNNDSWAIPRAYFSLKVILSSRPDLADKIISCAGNIPTYELKENDPYGVGDKTAVVSSCGQLYESIIEIKPSLVKPAFDAMKEELKDISRFGNGNEWNVLEKINKYLDTKPEATKDIATVLNEMLNNDLKDGKDPFIFGNYQDAVLKLQPQHMGIILEGVFAGAKRTAPKVNAPGEKYLKTINEMVEKNPNLAKDVLDGLLSVLSTRRMEEKEVRAIENIFVTIGKNKPEFIDIKIVPIINAMYYQRGYMFSQDKLQTLATYRNSYNDAVNLDKKVDEIKERLKKSDETKSGNEKSAMGKTENKEKTNVTAAETAKIHNEGR